MRTVSDLAAAIRHRDGVVVVLPRVARRGLDADVRSQPEDHDRGKSAVAQRLVQRGTDKCASSWPPGLAYASASQGLSAERTSISRAEP